jgi:hypothetical protein
MNDPSSATPPKASDVVARAPGPCFGLMVPGAYGAAGYCVEAYWLELTWPGAFWVDSYGFDAYGFGAYGFGGG